MNDDTEPTAAPMSERIRNAGAERQRAAYAQLFRNSMPPSDTERTDSDDGDDAA